MAEAARVIRISGSREQQLRDAIQSGMLSADADRAYRRVLDDNKRLRSENRKLKERLAVVDQSRTEDRRYKIEAYRMVLEKDAEYRRARDWRVATCIGLMSIGGFAVSIATVLVML